MQFEQIEPASHTRPRLVTIMGWLLLLQSIVLSAFGIYHFVILQFGPLLLRQWWLGNLYQGNRLVNLWFLLNDLTSQALEQRELNILIESVALIVFALFALIASFGFFSQRKWAWLLAMLIQGITLSLAVILYFIKQPAHAYILMGYCSVMVLYLQHADVYKSFQKTQLFLENPEDGHYNPN
jgi:hypothetical protein